jgi:hypothetical protein
LFEKSAHASIGREKIAIGTKGTKSGPNEWDSE